jgi:superfamily II DNA helicase RecQ
MPFEGHLTRLGRTLRKHKKIVNTIKHVSVDEAHHVASAGMPGSLGQAPWRPAYGKLDLFRLLLNKSTSFFSFSAMVTPFVERVLDRKLAMRTNQIKFRAGLNRPNICYASHDIVDSVNTQDLSRNASRHLNTRFPIELQRLGICKHYHSGMSAEYIQATYDDFASPSGNCLILCATKGASTVRVHFLSTSFNMHTY